MTTHAISSNPEVGTLVEYEQHPKFVWVHQLMFSAQKHENNEAKNKVAQTAPISHKSINNHQCNFKIPPTQATLHDNEDS